MSGHTTRLTTSPFRTTAGSYENPVEGIVDYGAFDRGFQKGIEPGLEALKEKKKKEEELDKIELDVSTEGIAGVSKNVMTGGVDLKTNDLLELNAVEAMSRFRPQYIRAKRNGDLQLQNRILRSIGNAKKSYSNLAAYVRNIGDPKTIDGNVSNTNFIDENGTEIEFNSVDFTKLNNNRSNQIRQGVKVNENGIAKQGFYVLDEDGKQLFLNTQDMDSAWMATHFKVKNNLQADIGDSVGKDGVNELYNRTATYFTDTDATTTIRLSNGNTVTTKVGDGTKYIRPEFYEKAEAGAVKFAQTEYVDENDPGFESAWNQLSNDESFTSFLDGKYISPEERKNSFYTTEEKIAMLRDHAAERWKISVADQGYVIGKSVELTDEYIKANNPDLAEATDADLEVFREAAVSNGTAIKEGEKFILITNLGRGEKRNELQYNKTFTQTTKPIEKEEKGDSGSFNALNIVEDLNTQFNAITTDAERELNKTKYDDGDTLTGQQEAPRMFNFLTNKSYMKGGSEKSIDNVEYRVVGDGESRKILLDIFTTSSGNEDPLATVDLSDTIARRDFLTNIGQGLAVTADEKQAVRDETKALTESRDLAFKVFKDLNVGGRNSNRWNVLARALRNNSSEGLTAEERKAFLKAGYPKQ